MSARCRCGRALVPDSLTDLCPRCFSLPDREALAEMEAGITLRQARGADGQSVLVAAVQPVDVLAVMQRRADFIDCSGKSGNAHNRAMADELREARAAVAELVSACESAREFMDSALSGTEHDDNLRFFDAKLAAALARIGGAK